MHRNTHSHLPAVHSVASKLDAERRHLWSECACVRPRDGRPFKHGENCTKAEKNTNGINRVGLRTHFPIECIIARWFMPHSKERIFTSLFHLRLNRFVVGFFCSLNVAMKWRFGRATIEWKLVEKWNESTERTKAKVRGKTVGTRIAFHILVI